MKKPLIRKRIGTARPKKVVLPKKGFKRPIFDSLLEFDGGVPFDVDADSLGLQADSDEEMGAALQSVVNERKQNEDMYRVVNDHDYYVLVCFQSNAQKLDFLKRAGWLRFGKRFIDGLKLAEFLNIAVKRIDLPMRAYSKKMPVRLRAKEVIK